jgi:hypothetical protein
MVVTETRINETTQIIKALSTETIEILFGGRFREIRKDTHEYHVYLNSVHKQLQSGIIPLDQNNWRMWNILNI